MRYYIRRHHQTQKGLIHNEKHQHHCMTEDRSKTLKLCFEKMEEITRLHDDLEGSLNHVKDELKYILSFLSVRDYHHDETLQYLGHKPDPKLNEGEIELTNSDIRYIRERCTDTIAEVVYQLHPELETEEDDE